MAAMMKKQMLASTTTKRSTIVAQASKSSDSPWYGPNRGQFLGPFSKPSYVAQCVYSRLQQLRVV
jgi:hypothetical protein